MKGNIEFLFSMSAMSLSFFAWPQPPLPSCPSCLPNGSPLVAGGGGSIALRSSVASSALPASSISLAWSGIIMISPGGYVIYYISTLEISLSLAVSLSPSEAPAGGGGLLVKFAFSPSACTCPSRDCMQADCLVLPSLPPGRRHTGGLRLDTSVQDRRRVFLLSAEEVRIALVGPSSASHYQHYPPRLGWTASSAWGLQPPRSPRQHRVLLVAEA